MKERLEQLRRALRERELDAILISSAENRRYVSGFAGSAGYLLVSEADAILATDFRYVEQAGRQAPLFQVRRIGGAVDWLPELAKDLDLGRVGIESENMTVASHDVFKKALTEAGSTAELVATSAVVEDLRGVKDAGEIELLERAVEISDQAFEEVAPTVKPGMTEEEVAWQLEMAMRSRGAESISFDIIVAAGPNGALPHHRAGKKIIENGDPVVIDMGCVYEGYCSDLSRTIVAGSPDESFRHVYNTVLGAQEQAEDSVRAGMTGGETDAISREMIGSAGFGENFGHSLGHGVGLEVHEYPRLGPKTPDRLENGMVFTIEPGIYLSGWGGVRIEDMVVLENGSPRILSKAHKSWSVGQAGE